MIRVILASLALLATMTTAVEVRGPQSLCIMPLGDSLTQGVGKYGSYRQPLADKLAADGINAAFTGSLEYPCTPKLPLEPYKKDDARPLPHEGHCNWASGQLSKELPTLLSNAKSSDESVCGRDGPDAVLLLVGHNDIFQVAKLCKVREKSKEKTDCATKHFRSGFFKNLLAIVDTLRPSSSHGIVPNRPVILIGLNPPTGFPGLEQQIHEYISVVAAMRRLTTVKFPDWRTGVHTFDTTHPNAKGNDIMADAWLAALRETALKSTPVPGSTPEDTRCMTTEAEMKILSKMMRPTQKPNNKAAAVDRRPVRPAERPNVPEVSREEDSVFWSLMGMASLIAVPVGAWYCLRYM